MATLLPVTGTRLDHKAYFMFRRMEDIVSLVKAINQAEFLAAREQNEAKRKMQIELVSYATRFLEEKLNAELNELYTDIDNYRKNISLVSGSSRSNDSDSRGSDSSKSRKLSDLFNPK